MKKVTWLLEILKINSTASIAWLFPFFGLLTFTNELFIPANAQSIIPAPDGTGTIVTPQGNRIDITGGQKSRDGVNLFHSFTRFGLSSEQIANFLSHPEIQNILVRINGGEASFINGLIQVKGANSNLFLMNPSGIIFGSNARLNVPASFIATTANGIGFGNNWFNALGNNNYADLVGVPNAFAFTMNQPGTIFNSGNLTVTTDQTLALVGGTVINTGQLTAPSGQITLASVPGESFVRLSQPGFVLSLMIPSPTANHNQPTQWTLPILSLPQLLTGGSGGNATGVTVNSDGTVQLTGSGIQIPTDSSITIASGTINTSNLQNQGGTVHILGDRTGILSANINASGNKGGGNILIGGDVQGKGTVPNAIYTFISADSTINADALNNGNGGQVIVWADKATRIYGNISARGGQNSGNGGFVETSGRDFFQITTTPDLSAVTGIGGTWLIDPNDIAIVPGTGNTNINTSNPFEFVATGENAQIGIDLITAALTGNANVTVTTGGSGNISFNAPLDFNNTGNNSLTLSATGNIDINANITDSQPGGDSLNVSLVADSDNSSGGRISFNNVTINTGGGTLTGIAKGNRQFPEAISIDNSTINSGGGNITLTGTSTASVNNRGITISNSNLNAGGGNINLTGGGAAGNDSRGIYLDNGAVLATQGTGTITLRGISGTGTDANYGLLILTNSLISSENGEINLTGISNGSGSSTYGIWLSEGSAVQATGTGNITLTGTNNATGSNNDGIAITKNSEVVSTGTGNITLIGKAGNGKNLNYGVIIGSESSRVAAANGNINLTGTGGGTGNYNYGILLQNSGFVEAGGTGAVTLNGTGGAGVDNNNGIQIEGTNSRISSVNGIITLTGIGKGTGKENQGIDIVNSALVESTGTGTITLTGIGSNGAEGISLNSGSINPTGTGSGSINLIADEINISETATTKIAGTGTLLLQPLTSGLGITVGGTSAQSDTRLNIDTNELANLQNEFSQIVIGRADGNDEITVNNVTFNDPVTIQSPNGSIVVNGAITGLDNASITVSGNTKLNANITTNKQNLTINGNTIIGNNVTLDTGASGGGNLLLNGTVDGSGNLTLSAGTGNITLNSAVGSNIPLGNFTINSAGDVKADSITAASIVQLAGTGTTNLGSLNTNSSLGIDLTGNVFNFNGNITTSNNGGLRLNNSGSLNIPATLNINLDGVFNQIGSGAIFTAGNITTTNDDIRFNAPVTLTGNATFNPGLGAIAFNSTLTSGNNQLTLRASEIDFGGLVTGSNTLILEPATVEQNIVIAGSLPGALNLSAAEIAAIQNGFSSITIGRIDGTGTITVNNVTFNDPVTIQSSNGSIVVNGAITGLDNAAITLDAATTTLNANITTADQNISIGRNVLLGSNATLSTGSGTGDITFTGAVNGTQQLKLDAGTGNVRFNAGVGGVTPLGSLEINAQNVFVSSGITTANSELTFNMPVILTENASFSTGEGTANITFNSPIFSETGEANNLTLTIGGNIRTADITTNGGNISLSSSSGTVTSGTLDASSTSGNGGTISLTSPTGAVISGNLNAKGVTKGGNVTVISSDKINAGNIDVSASIGDGGNVLLDPPNNVEVGFINAQGGTSGKGGSVDITTARFFQAKNSFIDQKGVNSSISTAGGVGSGSITIRHGGGDLETPFIVGDATTNGTVGALTTGVDLILPTRSFPGSFTLGNIRIITSDRFLSQLYLLTLIERENPPPQETIAQIPGSPIDSIVGALEEKFTRQYEAYFQQNTETTIKSLTNIRGQLLAAEQATGVKSAVVYIAFGHGGSGLEALLTCSKKPGELRGNLVCSVPNAQCPIDICDRTDKDILELVLVTAEGEVIRHQVQGVTRSQILAIANQLQREVTSPGNIGTANYLAPAQQLYQWLIAPLQPELQRRGIHNLVFIPDIGLRSIPIAVLHDGQKFIVEQYSISLMPSFSLTNPRYFNLKNASVLAMGASKFTNLIPLPAVPVELSTITPLLWPGKTALNEAFTVNNLKLQRTLKPFEIVHLATHAEFQPGEPKNSFIQFWDTKLRLDQVKEINWNNPPVHLLVLSACKTAIGDEQAELGYAGLAVQTQAKSALASLWYVSDEGTLGLMTEFYERLKTAPIRAEALRQAQVAMIRQEVYVNEGKLYGPGKSAIPLPSELLNTTESQHTNFSHPYFWAAFTLIGNPW